MILITCPTSRGGRCRRLWPLWQKKLELSGVDFRVIETEYPGHAEEIARAATEPVVAVGGDGTINEVISGVLAAPVQNPVGVLYAGTSPDFCRFHRIPIDPEKAVETLINADAQPVDVVQIRYHTKSGDEITGYFGCSCNIGLGADVARFSNRWRPWTGDTMGTLLGVVRAIAFHTSRDLEIEIDGEPFHLPQCNHLLLVKNPHIASGLKLDLDLTGDDGRAFVIALCQKSRLGLCCRLPGFYTGRITRATDIFLKPFSHVKLNTGGTSNRSMEIEFDGDPRGLLPLEATVQPRRLLLTGASRA